MILTKQVSDAHLAGLRRDGVSYIFAGERELDLALALDILNRELGIERLLLEGGGKSNGSFLPPQWPFRSVRSGRRSAKAGLSLLQWTPLPGSPTRPEPCRAPFLSDWR